MISEILLFPEEIRHYPRRKALPEPLREKIAKLFANSWEESLKFGTLSELSRATRISMSSIIMLKHAEKTNESVTGEKLVALFAALGYNIIYCEKNGRPVTNVSRSMEELYESKAFISFPPKKR